MKTNTTDTDAIYKAIYDVARSIPKGRVSSYGAIAKAVGLKSGARMVGRAMGAVMGVKPRVPVQRVVNSSGMLSGDDGSRQKMLEAEGVKVKSAKVVDFKKIFWDPMEEL
jgi:methylated-DNA-protein-cysteine methyltransferase related protein